VVGSTDRRGESGLGELALVLLVLLVLLNARMKC
jgi:hypothetical protein